MLLWKLQPLFLFSFSLQIAEEMNTYYILCTTPALKVGLPHIFTLCQFSCCQIACISADGFCWGLFWYVMLSDAICCKLTSWPESYPTSHALRLHHTREVSWDYIFFLQAVLQIFAFMGITYLLRKGKLEQFSISILQEQKGKSHSVR